jgi:AcrR family transcriptional regulator
MRALLNPAGLAPVQDGEGHRGRLLAGMASALVEKGYSATTIADVARHARVSKRTFYEHFADKEECFIACYEAASETAIQSILGALSAPMPWDERVRVATETYLSMLEHNPALTRTLMMNIYAAGPGALKVRRDVQKRFARVFRELVDRGRAEYPGLGRLSPDMAAAVIGGVNELVLLAVEEGRAHRLTELAGTANALMRAVLVSLFDEGSGTPEARPAPGAPLSSSKPRRSR